MSKEKIEEIKEEDDLGERIRKWYESYDNCPPWSSVAGFIVREIKKECLKKDQEWQDKIKTRLKNFPRHWRNKF